MLCFDAARHPHDQAVAALNEPDQTLFTYSVVPGSPSAAGLRPAHPHHRSGHRHEWRVYGHVCLPEDRLRGRSADRRPFRPSRATAGACAAERQPGAASGAAAGLERGGRPTPPTSTCRAQAGDAVINGEPSSLSLRVMADPLVVTLSSFNSPRRLGEVRPCRALVMRGRGLQAAAADCGDPRCSRRPSVVSRCLGGGRCRRYPWATVVIAEQRVEPGRHADLTQKRSVNLEAAGRQGIP